MDSITYYIPQPSYEVFQQSLSFWTSFPDVTIVEQDFTEPIHQGKLNLAYNLPDHADGVQYQLHFKKNPKKCNSTIVILEISLEKKSNATIEDKGVFFPILEWCQTMGISPISMRRGQYYTLWIIAGIAILSLIIFQVLRVF